LSVDKSAPFDDIENAFAEAVAQDSNVVMPLPKALLVQR